MDDWDETSFTENNECDDIENESECEAIVDEVTGLNYCYWDYSGQGIEYQILAGPIFVVIMTVSGVIIGFFGDKVSRWVFLYKIHTIRLRYECTVPTYCTA